ncbi:MAG: dephospho-CoA kinase [Candidatus Cloacimonetes bacterium]|jgi:dephospho-CoA kinase|nr:dephospho-CoA kinase [Candidatus Cloacimonadota bacterium]
MKHPDKPFLVAITGGIASGKTVVSNWFEEQNFSVFYADNIGHELLNDRYYKNKIEEIFGKEVFINDSVDRIKLGQIIFNCDDKRNQLNELLHPEIRKSMKLIFDASSKETLIFEIPLLFETHLENAFDLDINIWTEEETQLERLMNKKTMTREEALKRISSQMSTSEKQKRADINIENNTSMSVLKNSLSKILLEVNKKKFKEVTDLLEC